MGRQASKESMTMIYIEKRLMVAKGGREGEGRTGSLGLVDANYYIY